MTWSVRPRRRRDARAAAPRFDRRSAAFAPLWLGGFVAGLTAGGWLVTRSGVGTVLVVAAAGAFALAALAWVQRGVLLGVLVLAVMNGIPFLNTSTHVTGKVQLSDVAAILLIGVAAIWSVTDGNTVGRTVLARRVSYAGLALVLWWLITLARTLIDAHVPFTGAVGFGRDFLYFGVLLAILPRLSCGPRDIGALLATLTVGVCIFAAGQIGVALGLGQFTAVVHSDLTVQAFGLTRVYSDMTDLANLGLAVAVGASLIARRAVVRRLARPVALLLLVSVAVQLTRARWIGLTIGFLLVTAFVMASRNTDLAGRLRRRVGALLGVGAAAVGVALLLAPSLIANNALLGRLVSTLTDLESGSGSVAVRQSVARAMIALLGGRWPVGLGFIPPATHFFADLPLGSLRDPDLGVLNAVMTMGVVGAGVLYFAVIVTACGALRMLVRPRVSDDEWLRYGGAVWLVAALVSSITLVTLFSVSGLVLTSVVIFILVQEPARAEPVAASYPFSGGEPKALATPVRG
jgi:hypothetical protein